MKINSQFYVPTYLHFLDRELRRAEGATYTDLTIIKFVITAIIKSLSFCYCNASILIESKETFSVSTDLLLDLEELGLVKLLTNEFSYEEFIISRQTLYAHKSDRYPMYFNEKIVPIWPVNPQIITGSTTGELRKNILGWLMSSEFDHPLIKQSFEVEALNTFEEKLKQKEKAVTLDLILNEEQLKNHELRIKSGRIISYFYTKRYLDVYQGQLLCNLPQITFYDRLSPNRFVNDFVMIASILNSIGISKLFFSDNQEFKKVNFMTLIFHKDFKHIQIELLAIIKGLTTEAEQRFGGNIITVTRIFIDYVNLTKVNHEFDQDLDNQLNFYYIKLTSASALLSKTSEYFYDGYTMTKSALSLNKKVLIVVATSIEATAFFQAMAKEGYSPSHVENGKIVYWNFGVVNNCEISMIKTNMGSSGVSGSTLTIQEALKEISPAFVIMIGIAFGLKRKHQNIGDILISKQLENYDLAKIARNVVLMRADKIPAGPLLFGRFDAASITYSKHKVSSGLIISGDKLVDSEEFVNGLRKSFPEAIGGEMEGAGLQSACHREKTEWILIKGICDWGFDKDIPEKDANQKLAVENVCEFLIYTFKNFKF